MSQKNASIDAHKLQCFDLCNIEFRLNYVSKGRKRMQAFNDKNGPSLCP